MDVRIYDNGGETFDRYTVIYPDGYWLGVGESGNTPNGFCMTVEGIEGPHLGTPVKFADVPERVQAAIMDFDSEDDELCLICGGREHGGHCDTADPEEEES